MILKLLILTLARFYVASGWSNPSSESTTKKPDTIYLKDFNWDFDYLEWKQQHGKFNIRRNENLLYANFRQNRDFVLHFNYHKRTPTTFFKISLNCFADLSPTQVEAEKFGYRPVMLNRKIVVAAREAHERRTFWGERALMPHSLDWRRHGAVGSVQDQGKCAASWAFTAADVLASRRQILAKDSFVPLSVQNLIDCGWSFGNGGCNGGTVAAAFEYVAHSEGLNSAKSYPYMGFGTHICRFNNSVIAKHGMINKHSPYTILPSGNETAMMEALQSGPISVAIDASPRSFLFYKSGVYSDKSSCDSSKANHALIIVGYGIEEFQDKQSERPVKVPYWIIKNSWGDQWGENGYARLIRGINICGIANHAAYPNMAY